MKNPIDIVLQLFPAEYHERIYLVGGCVRDLLLGSDICDIDLISSLSPDQMVSCGFRLVTGISTAPIWFRHADATGAIEVTLIPDAGNLTADLARRDFTINALAMKLDGEIIDPLNGRNDLDIKSLRACSALTFNSDPLRIFRALRFESDGWAMDPETERLIIDRDWSGAWSAIPMERFSRELLKALQLKKPERFFQRMLELGVGAEYLPELYQMPLVPAGPLIHHPEGDLLIHSIQVLQRVTVLTDDPLIRFCAMFHDIGKLATDPALYPRHHGHDQTGFKMAVEFCLRLRLPSQYGKVLSWISKLHGTFNLWDQLRVSTKLRVADQAIKAGIVDVLPLVAAADKAGGGEPEEWRMIIEIAGMSAAALGIDLLHLEQLPPKKRADFVLQARILKMQMCSSLH